MTTRGWCPDVHAPMASGDGMLARVKPPGGRLPSAALRAIATAASEHGNGTIELTSRGNLQIRGLTPDSAPRFAAAMVAAGLADPDPARESRRNVITVPPCDDGLADAVEALLAGIPDLAPKFCIALGPADADIVILDGEVRAEGVVHPFSLDIVARLARLAGGKRLRRTRLAAPAPADAQLLALPFGQTDAAAFLRLAALTGAARTTPWRALHIPACGDPAPYAAAGFIIHAGDPRLTIAACPGAPACASGTTATRSDATRLAALGVLGIHVSGCSKGCASQRPGLTLVGRDGHYDVVRWGLAGDAAAASGLSLEEVLLLIEGQGLCPWTPQKAVGPLNPFI